MKLASLEKFIKEFEKRFVISFPIIRDVRTKSVSPGISDIASLQNEIQLLSDALEQGNWQQLQLTFPSTTSPSPKMLLSTLTSEAELKDIKFQLHQQYQIQCWHQHRHLVACLQILSSFSFSIKKA
jgi:hypothetical protein